MKKNREALNLILGGGLAGLSTAYHLKKKPWLLVEREKEVGGTARSFKIGGFTFDFTGHLLHLHNPYTKKLIRRLLKDQFFSCVRNTLIYSKGIYTQYPFQASTRGLPDSVIDDCVLGFLDTYLRNQKRGTKKPELNFAKWCRQTFGPGISKHFMTPYNEKLFQTPAHRLSTEWCGPFVPMPKLEEVIEGALADQSKRFGYNTTFLYPKKGGIQQLAVALSENLKNIELRTTVKKLDWKRKRAWLSNGKEVAYRNLVNTIPLLEFLKLMRPLPPAIEKARRQLKFASILCVNVGVKRAHISKASWIYFPEPQFPFYRVGFPMNFTPHVVPRGCSSMYVEVPMKDVKGMSNREILKKIRAGLIESKILKPSDKIVLAQFLPIRYAYVIYDQNRRKALPTIFSFLARHGIQSIGRYGAWKYSFMEEAILDGKKASELIA